MSKPRHDMIIALVNIASMFCVFRCCNSLINVCVRLKLHRTLGYIDLSGLSSTFIDVSVCVCGRRSAVGEKKD